MTSEAIPRRPLATSFSLRRLRPKLAAGVALAALADWLFVGGDDVGLSLAIFLAALAAASIIANRRRASLIDVGLASAILLAGLAAIVEDPSPLAIVLGILGAIVFACALADRASLSLATLAPRAVTLTAIAPIASVYDLYRIRARIGRLTGKRRGGALRILGGLVPLVILAVFTALLVDGNPIFDLWVAAVLPRFDLDFASLRHPLFMAWVALMIWPLLRIWRRRSKPAQPAAAESTAAPDATRPTTSRLDLIFGAGSILSSLVMLDLLFAVQTATDLVYLWGGATLPPGLTYAAYAHRGAYSLIVAALLAAAFVLIATRQGGPAERSPWIRRLVLVFVLQNVSLVVSAMLRLDLYVAVYSLTYWRVAAFVWMGLVAFGLLAIVVKLLRGRSNAWLLEMNVRALYAALIGCCLVNLPATIADYNVAHMRAAGSCCGPRLDEGYLLSLGPQAVPAIDAYVLAAPERASAVLPTRNLHAGRREGGWRTWSFRRWRLERYLDQHPRPQPSTEGRPAPTVER